MIRLFQVLLFIIGTMSSLNVVANNLTRVSLNDETYMIVDVQLQSKVILLKGVEVFIHQGEYMLPLFTITNALKLNSSINVDKTEFLLEFNSYKTEVNFANNDINTDVNIDNRDIFWNENGFDIYVSAHFIEHLLQAEITPEISNLIFMINPINESLLYPIELQLQREAEKENRLFNNYKSKVINLGQVFIEDQYRLIMPPNIFTRIRYNKFTDTNVSDVSNFGSNSQSSEQSFQEESSISTTGTSDILYHSARYSINWRDDTDTVSTIQFAKYKTSPYDVLPGNVDYYAFGDVNSYASSLTKINSGVGLTFSQKEDRYSFEFGQTTIDGIAPPGWQAELYDGGFFIGETIVNDDGQYFFNEVNTRYGVNQYRIVLYGPYGEVETRYETVRIGTNWLKTGDISYRGAFFDSDRKLLDSEQYRQQGFEYEVDALNFGFDYGVNDSTQWQLIYHQDKGSDDTVQRYLSSQAQINFDSNAVTIGVAGKEGAGYAAEMIWLGNTDRYDSFGFNIQYADDYDLIFGVLDNTIFQASASYHSRLDILGNSILDLYSKYSKVEQEYESLSHSGRLSWNMFGLNMKFSLINTDFTSLNADSDTSSKTIASISASGGLADGRMTLTLEQEVGNSVYEQYNISYQNNFDNLFFYTNAQYTKTEFDGALWEGSSQLAYRSSKVLATSGISYNSQSKWRFTLGLDFSFGYDYQRNQFNFSSKYNQSGQLDIGAYLDRNNNFILDKGDYALEGVEFGSFKSWSELPTLRNGRTLLSPIPVKNVVNVEAKWRNVVKPSQGKHTLYTHPGGLVVADIPFTITTSMAGYVLFNDDTKLIGANGIRVNLIDVTKNEIVASESADEDGFFEFYNQKAGRYLIEIEIEDLLKRGLISSHRRFEFETPKRGGFIELGSFILKSGEEQNETTVVVLPNDNNYEPLFSGSDDDKEIYVNVSGEEELNKSTSIFNRTSRQANAKPESIKRTRIKLKPDVPITEILPTGVALYTENNLIGDAEVSPENINLISDDVSTDQILDANSLNKADLSNSGTLVSEQVESVEKFTRLEWRYGVQIAVFSSSAAADTYIESLDVKGIPVQAYYDEDNKLYRLILGELTKSINDVETSIGKYKPVLPNTDMFAKYFRVLVSY